LSLGQAISLVRRLTRSGLHRFRLMMRLRGLNGICDTVSARNLAAPVLPSASGSPTMITLFGFGRVHRQVVAEGRDLRVEWALEVTVLPYRVHTPRSYRW